jgi:hypothetical protein
VANSANSITQSPAPTESAPQANAGSGGGSSDFGTSIAGNLPARQNDGDVMKAHASQEAEAQAMKASEAEAAQALAVQEELKKMLEEKSANSSDLEQSKASPGAGFDTAAPNDGAVAGLRENPGAVNPDATTGGMPPPSAAAMEPAPPAASSANNVAAPVPEPEISVAPNAEATPNPGSAAGEASAPAPPVVSSPNNEAASPSQPEIFTAPNPGSMPSPPPITSEASTPGPPTQTQPDQGGFDSSVNTLDDADRILKKMDLGQMAFNVPASMPVNQSATINLLISPNETTNELVAIVAQEVSDQGQQTGRVESASLKVAGNMQALLVGSDSAFNIKLITPEIQMLSHTAPTEWKWQIDSKQAGSQSLHLTVNAILHYNGGDHYQMIRTFDRVIQVNVTPAAPAVRYLPLEILLGLLAGGGIVLFLRERIRRRVRKSASVLKAMSGGADIFLSYSRRDSDRILPLVEKLRQAGFQVWIDQGGIDGAVLWAKEITDAIRNTKAFILVASSTSFASDHVTREISLAMEEKKPILPVYLEPVEMPSAIRYSLAGIQHIELYSGDRNEKLAAVVRSLEKLGIAGRKPA